MLRKHIVSTWGRRYHRSASCSAHKNGGTKLSLLRGTTAFTNRTNVDARRFPAIGAHLSEPLLHSTLSRTSPPGRHSSGTISIGTESEPTQRKRIISYSRCQHDLRAASSHHGISVSRTFSASVMRTTFFTGGPSSSASMLGLTCSGKAQAAAQLVASLKHCIAACYFRCMSVLCCTSFLVALNFH